MGAMESGIIYTVDLLENGYMINAQVSVEALGFVQLPEMKEIFLSIDIIDTDIRHKRGATTLSTSPQLRQSQEERTYNKIELSSPLVTNFSRAPDRMYKLSGFEPVFTYTQMGWVPTAIDVDPLAYYPNQSSQFLNEVKFMQWPIRYQTVFRQGKTLVGGATHHRV